VRDPLWLLRLYYFAGFAAFGIYLPAFPRWLEARGIEGLSLGLVTASMPVMGLVSPPLFGAVADATRLRGRLLLYTNLGAALSMVGLALFARQNAITYAVIIACVAAFAFFRAPMVSVADLIALEGGTTASYGRLRLWGSLGFLVAAVLSARFVDPTDAIALPLAIAGTLVIALLTATLLPARSRTAASSHASPSANGTAAVRAIRPSLWPLFACAFVWQMSHSAYDLCYSLRLRDMGIHGQTVGVLWALGVLAEVALMSQTGAIAARIGTAMLLCIGTAAASARWLLIAQAESLAGLLPIQAMHALSFASSWVALVSIVRDEADPKSLGLVQGSFAASVALGGGLGMLAWSGAYRSYGGVATFRMAAIVGVVATGLAVAFALARRAPSMSR
jgi:PPP family 3-phenylpropionic acid transporter